MSAGGVWAKAFNNDGPINGLTGFSNGFDFAATTHKLVSSGQCWYPAAGYRNYADDSFNNVGSCGYFWSCTPNTNNYLAYYFLFNYGGRVGPSSVFHRASGLSVRCLKEK